MRDWQPIDTLPTDQALDVLVVVEINGHRVVGEAHFHVEDGWYWANESAGDYHARQICPTHWMPLPDPPKVIEVERIAVSDDQSQAIPEARHQGQKMREGLR